MNIKNIWTLTLFVIFTGQLHAGQAGKDYYISEKHEADKIIEICKYGDQETYNLYVAKLDSYATIHGQSRDSLEKNISAVLNTGDIVACGNVAIDSKMIVEHYKLLLEESVRQDKTWLYLVCLMEVFILQRLVDNIVEQYLCSQ